ncbi:MAG: hypothetical protein U0Q15_00525 [Kineosporiaceae bacterium]
MGVTDAVALLTEAVEGSGLCTTPREQLVAALLKLMPLYGATSRLDLWEGHVGAAAFEIGADWPASTCEQALEAIYELGRLNLYGQFSADATAAELAQLRSRLTGLGITLPVVAFDATSQW